MKVVIHNILLDVKSLKGNWIVAWKILNVRIGYVSITYCHLVNCLMASIKEFGSCIEIAS